MSKDEFNFEENLDFQNSNSNNIITDKQNSPNKMSSNSHNYMNNLPSSNNNNYVYYASKKTQLRTPNDFIFLGDHLYIYREIPNIGNFYSYQNKSVKAIFKDKTICMMNQDQYFAKIINKYGEKELLFIPDLPANNPYYIYVKHLFDFYDACFNPEMLKVKEKKKIELEKKIDERINKIDLFNNLLYNKNKEDNYSKQYYVENIPTVMDVQNLLKRNQKALDNIEQIKNHY